MNEFGGKEERLNLLLRMCQAAVVVREPLYGAVTVSVNVVVTIFIDIVVVLTATAAANKSTSWRHGGGSGGS